MDDPKGRKSFGPRSRRRMVMRGLQRVSHLIKQAVDDASSGQRGKIPAIGCLPFAMTGLAISYLLNRWQKVDHTPVAPVLEAT